MSKWEKYYFDESKHKGHFVTTALKGNYAVAKMCYTCNKAYLLKNPIKENDEE